MGKEFPIKAVISAEDRFTSKMQKIAGQAKSIGKSMTIGLTLPILGIGSAAVASATEFNASMANVGTLIPGQVERIGELKKSVQDLAIETGKSTDDLSGGLFQVISAFGDTAETATILTINAKAAAAGIATTTDAINLTSAVTKGYGDTSATAVQHASDLAFMANKLGQTTFPELASSIGRVVPLASELKVTQEELFGVMATATGVTGGAAEVSTQLRGVLQSILAPTKDMTKLLKFMGFESGKALIEQKGLQGSITLIAKAAKLSKQPLQKFITSIEGQTLALALTGAQSDTFTKKLAAMKNVTGATDEAFAEQAQGVNKVGFTMQQLTQKVAVASQRLGDGLAPALGIVFDKLVPVIDFVVDLATGFSQLDPTLQTTITGVAGFVALLGPTVFILGSIANALAVVGTALKVVGLAAIANPLGAVLVILAGAAALIIAKWDVIGPFFADLWEGVKNAFQNALTFIEPIVNKVTGFVSSVTGGIQSIGKFLGFNQGPGLAGAPPSSAPPLPSALPAQGNSTSQSKVTVSFENAPKGLRVTENRSDSPNTQVDTNVGFSSLLAGVFD